MKKLFFQVRKFPFGKIGICCSGKGVREVRYYPARNIDCFPHNTQEVPAQWIPAESRKAMGAKIARRAVAEIGEYFTGCRQRFTVPLDLRGTLFQEKVWKALLHIPYGETRSYKEIARQVGNPRAARAVGMANHWNPVPILIPCHRVVASNGSLGGYAGGAEIKSHLLQLEQRIIREHKDFESRGCGSLFFPYPTEAVAPAPQTLRGVRRRHPASRQKEYQKRP